MVAVCVIVFQLASVISANHFADENKRYVFSLTNSLNKRVLPNKAYTDFFQKRGMPMTPAVMAMKGKWAHYGLGAKAYGNWIITEGKSTYVKWLLLNPWMTITHPMLDAAYRLVYPGVFYYYTNTGKFARRWKHIFQKSYDVSGLFYVVVFCFSLWLMLKRPEVLRRDFARLSCLLMMLGLSNAWVAYWGDAMEVPRHCLLGAILLLLGMKFLFVFQLDHRAKYERLLLVAK